jgi:GT2 family glycosyltransferase
VLECDTEYVALLNADAFPEKDWLDRLMACAQEFPDVSHVWVAADDVQ